jgi:hypothetical protein
MARVSWTDKDIAPPHTATAVDGSFETANTSNHVLGD